MRRASTRDIPALITLMEAFYAESAYPLDHAAAQRGFAALMADERLGQVWLIEEGAKIAGYAVLTFRFGMEFGGLMAAVDDLYIAPQSRNKGLAKTALKEIRERCKAAGITAITVEVSPNNAPALAAYRHAGFTEAKDRQLLVVELSRPTHQG
ncbi:MAG: hypothetical protein BroJett014_19380 [Planctomycetota bacterium]|nr:hypothetical protein [Planctomycetota bacterium]GIK52965.1 MAG: hypothetical protein BroJett014_19380 [Planctomycetota bacterium]